MSRKSRRRLRWAALGGGAAAAIAIAVTAPLGPAKGGTGPGSGARLVTMGPMPTMGPGPVAPAHLKLKPLSSLGKLQPAPYGGPDSYEGVPRPVAPPLAGTAKNATGQTVDGIKCQANEQLVFHVHAHLTLFVKGKPRQIPMGIGIPKAQMVWSPHNGPFIDAGKCFYWLHTHATDGIIHIESPTERGFTVGQFFDEWGQRLSSSQLGPYKGHVTAIFNGKVYVGNPRNIPLETHAQIQLEVGKPLVAPEKITFPRGL